MGHVAAFEAADHGVGEPEADRQRRDHGRVGAHDGARGVRGDAVPAGGLDIGVNEFAVARIVLRIDQHEVLFGPDREAVALEPRLDHGRAADQSRLGEPLFHDHLGGAQHALVLALGVDHPPRIGFRLGEKRLHDEAGAEHEAVEPALVGVEIDDRAGGDARLDRRLGDRGRDSQDQPRVERVRDQRARSEGPRLAAIGARGDVGGRLAGERGDGFDRRPLHLLVDGGGADVECPSEDVGKAQDVVDLVRIVGAAGADKGIRTGCYGLLGHDFGFGLASAMISGRLAIRLTMSAVRTPPAETPRKTSASPMMSASVRAFVSCA